MSVVIETTLGDVTADLFISERPQTCLNFIKLCKLKYYNLCLFHTVNANFCAQTGDPTGKGDGGESIHGILNGADQRFYQGETQPKIKHDRIGLLSMVSHGNGMLGSQFIITLSADLSSLDGEHVVFGEIVEGQELLLKLNEAITDDQHRPYQDIRITHTVILEDPFPDPTGMLTPPPSPVAPSTKDVAYSRIPADEPVADNCTQEELDELVQAREAAARATILEMVGDLPDADVAPPENVLFVCKLNPVTTDHDLSIIFSRFGKVKTCEVIRDSVTGDSLQYAFVEFEDPKSCEEAYFKMDNVLIDDRRIHVDFSQSVAKWRGKGKGVEMLGPPPKGGWGNKSKNHGQENNRDHMEGLRQDRRNFNRRREFENNRHDVKRNSKTEENDRHHNGSKASHAVKNKVLEKKETAKKKKRRESSSTASTSSESSDSSSSSDSSDTEPVRKKKRSSSKVLVVVKTPGSRNHKVRKIRTKSKKYDSESESEDERVKKRRKKNRKKSTSEDSSSEEDRKVKRSKKKDSSSDDECKRVKKKKRHNTETSSNSSDDEVRRKTAKKKKKRKVQKDSSSEEDRRKKKKRKREVKKKSSKKKKKAKSESDSDTSTSSSD